MRAAFAQGIRAKPLQALADKEGYINIGPIPKNTPVNLIANFQPDFGQLVVLQAKIANALLKIHTQNLSIGTGDRRIDQGDSGIARGEQVSRFCRRQRPLLWHRST